MSNHPKKFLYFAYGSNMSSRRILARIPRAERLGTGFVREHILKFHKISQNDGSGKCDIYQTNMFSDRVCGVIYRVSEEDKKILDRIEGLGVGYNQKDVEVIMESGESKIAFVYYALTVDPFIKPFNWYKQHVLQGAVENNLPKLYIQEIEKVLSIEDGDTVRSVKEMALYR